MEQMILENGEETTVTPQQAEQLLWLGRVYECDDCSTEIGIRVFHVTPGLEGMSGSELVAGLR